MLLSKLPSVLLIHFPRSVPLTIHQGLLGVHEQARPHIMVLLQHYQGLETDENQTWLIKPFQLFRLLFL